MSAARAVVVASAATPYSVAGRAGDPWTAGDVARLRRLLRSPAGWGGWRRRAARHFPGPTAKGVEMKAGWLAGLDPVVDVARRRGGR